jgi:hypothetical protein
MGRRWLVGAAGSAGVALVVACSFSSTGQGNTPTTTYFPDGADLVGSDGGAEKTIGAAGGSFTTADGVTIEVPVGALSADTAITVAASTAPAPSGVTVVGSAFLLGPEAQTFAKPVTITLPFRPTAIPLASSTGDVKAMTAGADGQYHPVNARTIDVSHVRFATRHFSTYVAVVPSTLPVCPACGGVAPYDDCRGCAWGFHVTGLSGQGACPAGTPAFGVHCEPNCGDAYQTACDVGCGPGYHVTSDGLSGQVGCEGFSSLTCAADVGVGYDTCDIGCDAPYAAAGTGVASCMSGDRPTHCEAQASSGATCQAGADAGDEGGTHDAASDAPRDAPGGG